MGNENSFFPRYDFSQLEPRDLRIIRLAAHGYSIVEIAHELRTSEALVKKRRSAILEQYGVQRLMPICISAALQGLIE